jgi:hypothetical protein
VAEHSYFYTDLVKRSYLSNHQQPLLTPYTPPWFWLSARRNNFQETAMLVKKAYVLYVLYLWDWKG